MGEHKVTSQWWEKATESGYWILKNSNESKLSEILLKV